MRTETSKGFLRLHYKAPDYQFGQVELEFELQAHRTLVQSVIEVMPSPHTKASAGEIPLVLDGQDLEFISLRINGQAHRHVEITPERMVIHGLPKKGKEQFQVEIKTACAPEKNTSLMGLYVSRGNFFTQCEAEGFRKITYFLDRPDVMARYRVTLRARKEDHPVLLSNGNLIASDDLGDGWHQAVWEDPFPKPSYLFALVAGKLICLEETVRSQSGAQKLLQIWVEPRDLQKTQHAMESLKSSMVWDEKRFGLELDLERFMIVAVGDFNMGAMENKGLNIFNTKFVLADAQTATDGDYANIKSVVAHEYFHNWTGNRVTCRDWFQLSLKEGLTVFRDQEFSADMMGGESGKVVKRIEDVRVLRQAQFPEDAGPMAHPVRPDSYVEINNFYTLTIYEKGAEVVRMLQTLLGRDGFRKGMDLYFQRHDGQAVTCDDFRAAMADANGRDLSQFERWYSQAGTPRVMATTNYDSAAETFTLELEQFCPPTPGQPLKQPMHIPFAVGLLNAQGDDLHLQLEGSKRSHAEVQKLPTTIVLELTQSKQSFKFIGVKQPPVPSLLRNFSAPVVLEANYSDQQLAFLLAHDSDPFNRWEAGQRLATRRLLSLCNEGVGPNQAYPVTSQDELLADALAQLLRDTSLDAAYRDLVLTLPSEVMLAEQVDVIDPDAIHNARCALRNYLSHVLRDDFIAAYNANHQSGSYSPDAISSGRRALRNNSLGYLAELNDSAIHQLIQDQLAQASNMTDRLAALSIMNVHQTPGIRDALQSFYKDFEHEALVIDKWFSLQASAPGTDTKAIRKLMEHPAFSMTNPNRARSLLFAFCNNNAAQFHATDGSGHAFWAEQVITLDKINPQVAARLARSMDRWRKFTPALQASMKMALEKVASTRKLSNDVAEVIGKSLSK